MDTTATTPAHWWGLEALFSRGYLGVDFFFILSGFIIQHVYRDVFAAGVSAADARRFVLYRFARIWPLHMVTLLGAMLLYAAATLVFHRLPADAASYSVLSVSANVLMVQSWFGLGSPNVPAWSISAEWAAYLAFPFLCWALMRLPLAGWIGLGLAAWLVTGTITHGAEQPLLRIACGFTLGVVLRECEGRLGLAQRLGRFTGLAVLAALLASCWLLPDSMVLPVVAGFALLILSLCNPRDLLGRVAALQPLVYLGEISFALYMSHAVVWSAFKNMIRVVAPGVEPVSLLPVLAGTVLSLTAAAVLYHAVEIPGRDLLRRGQRHALQSASTQAAGGIGRRLAADTASGR